MIMPTGYECICCCEVERVVIKKEESANEISCITDHCQAFSCIGHPKLNFFSR